MPQQKPPIRVRTYTRTDGTQVRSHNRARWSKAKAAWVSAGVSGATSMGLVAELGMTFIGVVAIILTALLTLLAVKVQEKSNPKRQKMRAAAKASSTTTARRRR